MTKPVRVAFGLWLVFGLVAWNASYDRQTKAAGRAFIVEQLVRYRQGLPLTTINQGFRPRVRTAAAQSSVWFLAVAGTGIAAISWARKTH